MAKCKLEKKVVEHIVGVTLNVSVEEFKALMLGIGRMSHNDLEREWAKKYRDESPKMGILQTIYDAMYTASEEFAEEVDQDGSEEIY